MGQVHAGYHEPGKPLGNRSLPHKAGRGTAYGPVPTSRNFIIRRYRAEPHLVP
jgi:hypothetical protein